MNCYEDLGSWSHPVPPCSDCEFLNGTLQFIELERRGLIDLSLRPRHTNADASRLVNEDLNDRLTRLTRLRDCTLEVLFKHQNLEHV
jgi:hypothetical protein